MGEKACEMPDIDLPRRREGAIDIDRPPGLGLGPIVDEGVAGPGIEGEDLLGARADPGDVRDAADVEHGDRFLETAGQSGVIERNEWCALAASRYIGGAEVSDHVNSGQPRQQGAVADLPGSPPVGLVEDRVAVEPDEVDPCEAVAGDKLGDHPRVRLGQLTLHCRHRTFAAEHRAELGSHGGVIGARQPRSGDDAALAVGLYESGIDSVQGRAAHEADDAAQARAHGSNAICRVPAIVLQGLARKILQPPMMSTARSSFLSAAEERGYIHQVTDRVALDGRLAAGPMVAYVGYDCTADSLHVGNLVSIMLLRLWQRTGNKPIVLMGGGTTKIGDPSGKDETRRLLSEAEIASNMAGIRRTFDHFLTFGDGPGDVVMADNAEWLDRLRYIPFLRDFGRHFSVNRMLTQDSVRLRLEREQPLSFLEFNYMVLQAYDFLELARRYDCALQMGGSDQWGNIVMGVELGRRVDNRSLFGLTSPLMTTASGAKMGKTAEGAVWLNPDRRSPYEYWQFWRNTEDADVGRFLRLFTELSLDEIKRLEALKGSDLNNAKAVLATEATTLCHGRAAAEAAAETARQVFAEGGTGSELRRLDVPRAELARGIPAFELFARSGLAASNSEARRLIKGGGARVNDRPIASETQAIGLAEVSPEGTVKLSAGKKRHALVHAV
jgi:tyrosyl-tRNA synthetase